MDYDLELIQRIWDGTDDQDKADAVNEVWGKLETHDRHAIVVAILNQRIEAAK